MTGDTDTTLFSYPTNEANSLAEKYSSIANASIQVSSWPDSEKFCTNLVHRKDEEGNQRLVCPAFDDGHGPIGAFAMLDNNKVARCILERCTNAFDSFVATVKEDILAKPSSDGPAATTTCRSPIWDVIRTPEKCLHISVSIFQEHPSLLHAIEDKQNWRSIDQAMQKQLAIKLSTHQKQICKSPLLVLDSILWTPDGAMIAGFVDGGKDHHYRSLLSSSVDIARDTIGCDLTSRPKSLIHVTIGRVLQKAGDSNQNQALTDLMRKYNEKVLPELLKSIRCDQSVNCGSFEIEEVSLGRNVVWPGVTFDIYDTWKLQQTTTNIKR